MYTPKKILVLSLCLSVILTSLYFLVLTAAGNGETAISEPDTRLFLQYARNISQGEPYVFIPGDAPSTGSTTHLYPFLLALPFLLDAEGSTVITAIYVLNVFFLLATLVMVWLIIKKMAPRALPVTMVLATISSHTLSAFLGMTDMGFFTFLALATFASILYNRFKLTLVLIFICSISRPEGFVFAMAFGICALVGAIWNHKNKIAPGEPRQYRQFGVYAVFGILAFLLTLALNHQLTGHFQFMSVTNKGFLKIYPFAGAIESIFFGIAIIIKGVFFGLPDSPRQFFMFPLLGGALGLSGILLYSRSDKKIQLCECWLALSAGASILLIASGGFQGVSNDRYLAWIFLAWIIYVSIGIIELNDRLKAKWFLPLCTALLVVYQLIAIAFTCSRNYEKAVALEKNQAFATTVAESFPSSTTTFGSTIGGGIGYYLPEYTLYNLSGITSPDFFEPDSEQQLQHIIDLLKHEKKLRFDYWFNYITFPSRNGWAKPFIGEQELIDTDSAITDPIYAYTINEAKWDTLDGGDLPLLSDKKLSTAKLVDRLDLGYIKEERTHGYSIRWRQKNMNIPVATLTDKLGESDYSEACRIVLGSESFNVYGTTQKKPLLIVLRTAKTVQGFVYSGAKKIPIKHLEIAENISLFGEVNGNEFSIPVQKIEEKGFTELLIEIPGKYIQGTTEHITISGDHISCAYWFYQ